MRHIVHKIFVLFGLNNMYRPKNYAKYSTLQRRDNEFMLDRFAPLVRWKNAPRILDVGSGDGATTLELLEPHIPRDYVTLVGCDLQEKMVGFARDSNRNPKVHFALFDIAGDKLLPGKYDHIFSFFTFHWVANLSKAFSNVYNLLTPGGDMLINLVSEIPYYDLLKRQLEHPVWSPYFSKDMIPPLQNCEHPEKFLRKCLTDNCFTDIKIYTEERDFTYNNWANCLNSLLVLDPIISKLDMEQKEEYIVDFFFTLKDTFSHCEESNGKITMPYKLLVVYASKPE